MSRRLLGRAGVVADERGGEMRHLPTWTRVLVLAAVTVGSACATRTSVVRRLEQVGDCVQLVADGIPGVAGRREQRFLGKVERYAANCRGGEVAVAQQGTPWLDWSNYYATGGDGSKSGRDLADRIGVDGALLDLELQRLELITFNLLDNSGTYPAYAQGRDGVEGPALTVWPEMRLPPDHARFADVGGDGVQVCRGDLVRHRTVTGICNDVKNPLMGSSGTLFSRNVAFDSASPRLGRTELVRNRHGDRLGLLRPDPQVISRRLFTRAQTAPDRCRDGEGLPDASADARCDYREAPFFNVLAAFWIQFMTHDWFTHLEEGHNREVDGRPDLMPVGCEHQLVDGVEVPLTTEQVATLGCRPDDRIDRVLITDDSEPPTFDVDGVRRLSRAPQTTRNGVTAWWDASQIYGYDATSRRRVKRDPDDRARLLLVARSRSSMLSTIDPSRWPRQSVTGVPSSSSWALVIAFVASQRCCPYTSRKGHSTPKRATTLPSGLGFQAW